MWWLVEKRKDNDKRIVYAYSRESKLQDGLNEFDKINPHFTCLKMCENDCMKSVEYFYQHLIGLIENEGAPDFRMVAIG